LDNAVNVLQNGFHRADRHRTESGGDRCRRIDVCLCEGQSKKVFAGIVFGIGMAWAP